jgi:hypothetical protein
VNDNDAYVTSFEQHNKIDDSTICAGSEHNDATLTHELVIPDERCGDWAEEIEEGMNYTSQDEYLQYRRAFNLFLYFSK